MQIQTASPAPDWFRQAVQAAAPGSGRHLAQLLWQRGIQDPAQLPGFLNPIYYQPASPFEFVDEMQWAVERLQQAIAAQETVAIWGDFDADGVTATAVLWEGLGQFFTPQTTLVYYIPNRLIESHGLSESGIDYLRDKGCRLIVTCDTGSTNLAEIDYANRLGIEVIVTDHHTLPEQRPPVVAMINPRSLPVNHPLAQLSGVAVAYKLVEALYQTLPDIPRSPLSNLLDLVAIGLIADLVELKGDGRYLAQMGIEQLQKQANPVTATRPGVSRLLEFCKRSGDRPTDISFGLGPRINAVSRIQGDAHFCVELLTSQDEQRCRHLAEATELANTRRKALQKELVQQVRDRLTQLDLSTTDVIVLADDQWHPGILGLVAGQIAQEYGRPTILLSTDAALDTADHKPADREPSKEQTDNQHSKTPLARGSARSVHQIDLYPLVKSQAHLLHRFGGHPYAAGLSLPVENIPLFREAINQQLRQRGDLTAIAPTPPVDLVVTVSELGKALFQELKRLEPCGMGNPTPQLLVQNCWFTNVWNQKIRDRTGRKIEYIKTDCELWDDSAAQGFPGVWWGHYREDIPQGRCDAIVELDFNTYINEEKGKKPHYEVRLIAVDARETSRNPGTPGQDAENLPILDYRVQPAQVLETTSSPSPLIIHTCPTSWAEFQVWFRRSQRERRPLAIAYPPPTLTAPLELWQKLVGIAKYLSRTQQSATRQQFLEKLGIGDRALQLGFQSLSQLGFAIHAQGNVFQMHLNNLILPTPSDSQLTATITHFLIAVKEEQFRRQYFFTLSPEIIRAVVSQTALDDLSEDNSAKPDN